MAKDYIVISDYRPKLYDEHVKYKIVPKCNSTEEAMKVSGWKPMFKEETLFVHELAQNGEFSIFTIGG